MDLILFFSSVLNVTGFFSSWEFSFLKTTLQKLFSWGNFTLVIIISTISSHLDGFLNPEGT